MKDIIKAFEKTIVNENGCWEYQYPNSKGYGPSRAVMERLAGYELDRLEFVLHKCDNPPCINPKHLEIGTPSENIKQAIERGRLKHKRNPRCKRGHIKDYINPTNGQANCRVCKKEHMRAKRAKAVDTP